MTRAAAPLRIRTRVLALASFALLTASIYRAATFAFTHDESLSFIHHVLQPTSLFDTSSNNHPLNTLFMRWSVSAVGALPFAMRMHSLCAHALYLACVWGCLQRFSAPMLQITGFCLLNLNVFVLDFFFLARGYGSALGLQALSLYMLVRAYEARRRLGLAKPLYCSLAAAALAILANFTFLNYFLALLFAGSWMSLGNGTMRRLGRQHVRTFVVLLAGAAAYFAWLLPVLFRLQRAGQFFAGGRDGLVEDTLRSLASSVLYDLPYAEGVSRAIVTVLIASFALLSLLALVLLLTTRQIPLFVVLYAMLVISLAVPVVEHLVVGTLYPVERMALYYLPLYALTLLYGLDELSTLLRRRNEWLATAPAALAGVAAALMVAHFARAYRTGTCLNWGFDRHNAEVLALVARDRQEHFPERTIHLGNGWIQEPSLNFYRITRGYTWLAPIERRSLQDPENQYLYAFESELPSLGEHERLATYADTKTVVIRLHPRR